SSSKSSVVPQATVLSTRTGTAGAATEPPGAMAPKTSAVLGGATPAVLANSVPLTPVAPAEGELFCTLTVRSTRSPGSILPLPPGGAPLPQTSTKLVLSSLGSGNSGLLHGEQEERLIS